MPTGVAVGDFNHDGKLDLVNTNTGSDTISVLLGTGIGTFQSIGFITLMILHHM
ncbi:VCBS repeat containing protein [Hyalomma marginatum]|uniref:VCBS repeat containing protein n=1 Tax=Hyalomma marginatum TaxID=34627 RepID=A0A8S4C4D2_9ACAR|nr:VCBS repeat containing protein [Hyalomma marginatum]CAG7599542.1 VCBS repeat containing protein [Hyalomma marginatum]